MDVRVKQQWIYDKTRWKRSMPSKTLVTWNTNVMTIAKRVQCVHIELKTYRITLFSAHLSSNQYRCKLEWQFSEMRVNFVPFRTVEDRTTTVYWEYAEFEHQSCETRFFIVYDTRNHSSDAYFSLQSHWLIIDHPNTFFGCRLVTWCSGKPSLFRSYIVRDSIPYNSPIRRTWLYHIIPWEITQERNERNVTTDFTWRYTNRQYIILFAVQTPIIPYMSIIFVRKNDSFWFEKVASENDKQEKDHGNLSLYDSLHFQSLLIVRTKLWFTTMSADAAHFLLNMKYTRCEFLMKRKIWKILLNPGSRCTEFIHMS